MHSRVYSGSALCSLFIIIEIKEFEFEIIIISYEVTSFALRSSFFLISSVLLATSLTLLWSASSSWH